VGRQVLKTCYLPGPRLPRFTAVVVRATALFTVAYIYAQGAAAFLQCFHQPVSLGSD